MLTKKLNLGSGKDIKPGWVNLDIFALPGVDVVHNIEQLPLPFQDGEFDEILCTDVLEHVEYVPILRDLHRIMAVGAKLRIRVPHFTSKFNFIDPTHRKMFSIGTFDFFVKNSFDNNNRGYYFDFNFSVCSEAKIRMEGGSIIFFLHPLVEWFINLSPSIQRVYESTFLSRLFPACNIEVTLVK